MWRRGGYNYDGSSSSGGSSSRGGSSFGGGSPSKDVSKKLIRSVGAKKHTARRWMNDVLHPPPRCFHMRAARR
jgi:hypothetical protein